MVAYSTSGVLFGSAAHLLCTVEAGFGRKDVVVAEELADSQLLNLEGLHLLILPVDAEEIGILIERLVVSLARGDLSKEGRRDEAKPEQV